MCSILEIMQTFIFSIMFMFLVLSTISATKLFLTDDRPVSEQFENNTAQIAVVNADLAELIYK